jgi:hypothetical protein
VTRLLANRWRGQYQHAAVVGRIRRTIRGSIVSHKTVLIDFEGTHVTRIQAAEIMAGWDTSTVKGCGCIHTLPFPLPGDVRIGVMQDGLAACRTDFDKNHKELS